jgi:Mg2+/Co2+ transporter CorC
MKIDDLNDYLNVKLSSEDYDSIGGLFIEHLDRLPAIGDQIVIDNLSFKVTSMDKMRINMVELIVLPIPEASEE